jgi:hypothetical protein
VTSYNIGDVVYRHHRTMAMRVIVRVVQRVVPEHLTVGRYDTPEQQQSWANYYKTYVVRDVKGNESEWSAPEISGTINGLIADHQKKIATLTAKRIELEKVK